MSVDLLKRRSEQVKKRGMESVLLFCAVLSVVITIGIVFVLFAESLSFLREISLEEVFLSLRWSPTIKPFSFGIWPLVSGTFFFSLTTALIAIPVGLLAAVYLSEYAGKRTRNVLKPALEVLAGIPTVIYGYFALVYITPVLRLVFPDVKTFNLLSASIVVAIMIIPTIASISEDAIRAVPKSLREAGLGLGITHYQVTTTIVIPSSLSGIISSFILGISRAVGETMAVTIAGGNLARIINPLDPASALLQPVQTMTAAMVEIGISDVTGDSPAYRSLFVIGLVLFASTLLLNIVSQVLKRRYMEVYQ